MTAALWGEERKNAFWLIAGWAGQGTMFCARDQNEAPPYLVKEGKKRVSGIRRISEGVVALSIFMLPPGRTACLLSDTFHTLNRLPLR